MGMPQDIEIIDLMLGFVSADNSKNYDFMKPLLRDRESLEEFRFPAQYMFKEVPASLQSDDYIQYTVELMDHFGIRRAMIGVSEKDTTGREALRRFPERFFASYGVDPNRGMEELRNIRRMHEEYGIKAVTAFPAGLFPQVALNDPRFYPLYMSCIDLDIVFCATACVPGPRLPLAPQKVEHIDELCWFFPELRFVIQHGAEPWEELAVKLMLKYPNLYYMTSAFAPKHYPKAIIHYANTRGADKIMYAGYFPMGLSLERIFSDMQNVPFRDHVWPKFLHENATRVFQL